MSCQKTWCVEWLSLSKIYDSSKVLISNHDTNTCTLTPGYKCTSRISYFAFSCSWTSCNWKAIIASCGCCIFKISIPGFCIFKNTSLYTVIWITAQRLWVFQSCRKNVLQNKFEMSSCQQLRFLCRVKNVFPNCKAEITNFPELVSYLSLEWIDRLYTDNELFQNGSTG